MRMRRTACAMLLLSAWTLPACQSKEVVIEDTTQQMTPQQKELLEQMKRMQEERDRTVGPVPIPQPGQRGVQPPPSPSYDR